MYFMYTYLCIHTFTSVWKVCKCLCEHKCLILLIYIRDMACVCIHTYEYILYVYMHVKVTCHTYKRAMSHMHVNEPRLQFVLT